MALHNKPIKPNMEEIMERVAVIPIKWLILSKERHRLL